MFAFTETHAAKPSLKQTCFAFFLYFGTQLLAAPLLMQFFSSVQEPILWTAWTSLLGLGLAWISVLVYSLFVTVKQGTHIWDIALDSEESHPVRAFFVGICFWPIAICLMSAALTLIHLLNIPPEETLPDQVAVQRLKESFRYLPLFIATLFSILVIAPMTEELLFRGFFQRMLSKSYSRFYSIFFTSLFFAAMHLSTAQGWSNIDIFVALFLLSLILGALYEKEKHLLASISLHMTFNAVNVANLIYTSFKTPEESIAWILFFKYQFCCL